MGGPSVKKERAHVGMTLGPTFLRCACPSGCLGPTHAPPPPAPCQFPVGSSSGAPIPERDEGAGKLGCREPNWREERGEWMWGEPRASAPQVHTFKEGKQKVEGFAALTSGWNALPFPAWCLPVHPSGLSWGHLKKFLESCHSSLPKCSFAQLPHRASIDIKEREFRTGWTGFDYWPGHPR